MSELFHECSLGWDYQNLGVLNTEMPLVMAENNVAPCFSPLESDFSSGYLEDALIEFTSKRRRLLPHTDEQSVNVDIDLQKNFWNFEPIWHQPAEKFYCITMNQIESNVREFSDEPISTSMSRITEESNIQAMSKGQEKTALSANESPDSSSSSYKIPVTSTTTEEENLFCTDPTTTSAGSSSEKRRKRVITRVVYPFAMVKPGGIREGEVTLNDINERILMPPTRPVRHPVGDFASRPCLSATGAGLSGKAVVALTRIHTQGRRGTITIIRTKG
ncbi:uncharacterized protein LOC129312126 [Prosopis cineraria]|uniref:uncharacterized protein LOC129300371 n=1 Tax=Prosopis cineraria TaxID=364024 RepID=UPI002410A914|nr:uncharacterized protein LOC129300371 [Prosopis cineraria]XP_054810696.1 uncharacterized protein LOC129312126 [Prosopis cineraria]